MAKLKNRTQFLCNSCGSVHPKWMGKCPDCGTWDSLEEYKAPTPDPRKPGPRGRDAATGDFTQGAEPRAISDLAGDDVARTATTIGEFDRILGGGIVPAARSWWAASRASENRRCSFRLPTSFRATPRQSAAPPRVQISKCFTSPARNPRGKQSSAPRAWESNPKISSSSPKRISNES